jgi:hypothetical protein
MNYTNVNFHFSSTCIICRLSSSQPSPILHSLDFRPLIQHHISVHTRSTSYPTKHYLLGMGFPCHVLLYER